MGSNDKELLKKLLVTFRVEADEHIHSISSGLIELERESSPAKQAALIESVFREAHSLKGAARAVNLVKLEARCQALEALFARLKAQETALSPELFDQLHKLVDALGVMLAASNSDGRLDESRILPEPLPQQSVNRDLSQTETSISQSMVSKSTESDDPPSVSDRSAESKQGSPETIRVPASKLDALLRQTEELIPAKATAAQRVTELQEIRQAVAVWEVEWRKVRSQAHALPTLADGEHRSNGQARASNGQTIARTPLAKVSAFLDRNENSLRSVQNQLAALGKRLEYDRRTLDRRVDDLVEDMKRVSMLPFSALLEFFPKLVRDLCRDCGKDADLTIVGGEIEIDRRILEEMKDPLIHLIRNCVDHGIEPSQQREHHHKPPRACIRIAISPRTADKVEIVVSDDGTGIDVQKVRAAAVKLGFLSPQEAQKMDERQSAALIFRSGLSTSSMITEVSGRGLGLAIVREKAEKVGGSVSVESQRGGGTTFRLVLPLTLARFRGVLVRVGESLFVLPTRYVHRVLRISRDEIKSAENRATIQINGRVASAVRLTDVLALPQRNTEPDPKQKVPVLVLAWAGELIGFLVDEILDEQEVLVKSLGRQLARVRNIAGATVLGTGKVLPVLNVADLMRSAINMTHVAAQRQTEEAPKSILVAEDSITARTLLKNILEFAGYKVQTAIDGAEALSVLAGASFDLVVSDVEMPRMGGFDLTAKIRADKRLSRLPVVLVTALDSRVDRERGVDVGANAYIVKSSFDQGNLLEVVRRLI